MEALHWILLGAYALAAIVTVVVVVKKIART